MNSVSPQQPPKLLDQLRASIRFRHYSLRTEQAYVHWVKRYIFFHNKRHPNEMGGPEVEAFLTYLADVGKVAVSTHQQALSALLFLYREVLKQDLPWMSDMGRPKTPKLPLGTPISLDFRHGCSPACGAAESLAALPPYESGVLLARGGVRGSAGEGASSNFTWPNR